MPLVVVVRPGRAVWTVVVIVLVLFFLKRRMMVIIGITAVLDFNAGSRLSTLRHQKTTAQAGENANYEQPCHKSKHGVKEHQ